MKKPLIFLAIANAQDLPGLNKEAQFIESALQEMVAQGHIQLESKKNITLDTLFEAIGDNRGQLKIFHFAGHANEEHVLLDGTRANGQGLADLLAEENKLNGIELVFLNGCATHGHVERILQAGVKAVIATRVEVNDHLATKFAIQFYESFADGSGIAEAYSRATAKVKAIEGASSNRLSMLGEIRRLGELKKAPETPKEIHWALYTEEKNNMRLTWSMEDIQKENLENFKKELYDLVDEMACNKVFQRIEKSDYKYEKFLFNRLRGQFAFKPDFDQIGQLKVFISSIKLK